MSRFEEELRAFVALCVSGRSLEAIDRFYADEVEARENDQAPRVGKALNRANEERNLRSLTAPPTLVARAVTWNEADGVSMIEWDIRFTPKKGAPMRLEEVAVQRWRDGKIVSERFFYEKMVEG
jgi:ketosteroid isomerase-like protein